MKLLLSVVGAAFIVVGVRWLQLSILTDYRAHLRPALIPLGLIAVILGIFLICIPRSKFPKRRN